jgi:hypothetical protein
VAGEFRVDTVPWRRMRAFVELKQGLLGMGKMMRACGATREREGEENGGEFQSETAAIATFLLGCCGSVELPLRTGEELARSRASRWASGVVLDGLSERTVERRRGLALYCQSGVR